MNWEDAEKAYQEATNSAGSAVKENEAFLDSIEGRKRVFKSAFESLSNDLLNGDLVKTGISAGTQIVKGSKGIKSDTFTSMVTKAAYASSSGQGGLATIGAAMSALTPLQATIGAVAAAAAAVGVAYKIWDDNTVQLSDAQEKLNDSLSNVSSAQQHIATIQEQIATNEKQMSEIRSSGVTTIEKSADLANLQRQNELLKTQLQYQQTISKIENEKAASSARAAIGISTGYVAGGGNGNDGERQ